LSFGFSLVVIISFTGSPDPRQPAFTAGHPARYPASYPRHRPGGERSVRRGFLPPFGHRHSLLGSSCSRPGSWAFLTAGLPHTATAVADPVGVSTFHTHEIRPG